MLSRRKFGTNLLTFRGTVAPAAVEAALASGSAASTVPASTSIGELDMVTMERAELKKPTWLRTLTLSDAVPRPVEYCVGGFRRNSRSRCTGTRHGAPAVNTPHAAPRKHTQHSVARTEPNVAPEVQLVAKVLDGDARAVRALAVVVADVVRRDGHPELARLDLLPLGRLGLLLRLEQQFVGRGRGVLHGHGRGRSGRHCGATADVYLFVIGAHHRRRRSSGQASCPHALTPKAREDRKGGEGGESARAFRHAITREVEAFRSSRKVERARRLLQLEFARIFAPNWCSYWQGGPERILPTMNSDPSTLASWDATQLADGRRTLFATSIPRPPLVCA
eukprot:1931663-Prymnesium_polylepis.3